MCPLHFRQLKAHAPHLVAPNSDEGGSAHSLVFSSALKPAQAISSVLKVIIFMNQSTHHSTTPSLRPSVAGACCVRRTGRTPMAARPSAYNRRGSKLDRGKGMAILPGMTI